MANSYEYICGGQEYFIGGPKADTIALPVSFQELPETLDINGYTLQRRSTFHVSLVCVGKIIEKEQVTVPDFLEKVVADFCTFTKEKPIEIEKCTDEFRFAEENERRTVVVMCRVTNLPEFFDLLNQKYDLNLDHPPTHVTLYTLQPDVGIFITDTKDIQNLTTPVNNPGVLDYL